MFSTVLTWVSSEEITTINGLLSLTTTWTPGIGGDTEGYPPLLASPWGKYSDDGEKNAEAAFLSSRHSPHACACGFNVSLINDSPSSNTLLFFHYLLNCFCRTL